MGAKQEQRTASGSGGQGLNCKSSAKRACDTKTMRAREQRGRKANLQALCELVLCLNHALLSIRPYEAEHWAGELAAERLNEEADLQEWARHGSCPPRALGHGMALVSNKKPELVLKKAKRHLQYSSGSCSTAADPGRHRVCR